MWILAITAQAYRFTTKTEFDSVCGSHFSEALLRKQTFVTNCPVIYRIVAAASVNGKYAVL